MKKSLTIIAVVSVSLLLSALAVLSLFKRNQNCKGLCAGCSGCKNGPNQSISYYVGKREKLLKELQSKQKVFEPALEKYYSAEETRAILRETEDAFVALLPGIPYIGGDANGMTEDIEQAAMVLAFYRVQLSHGRTGEEVGRIVTESVQREVDKYPKWLRHMIGGKFFTKRHLEELRESCATSQDKRFAGDWVTFYVEGNGKDFDYGYDHVECGIVKYLTGNDARDLIPYLCSLDFIYSDAFDEGLVRTETIAEDGQCCDFRYKRER